MSRFYRLTSQQSQQWIARYPELAQYYDHREFDWEDDLEGDDIYLIPQNEALILHIALSEYHTTDFEDVWHCEICHRYAVPMSQRRGAKCVQCDQL